MVATLYDASLDVYAKAQWQNRFYGFYQDRSWLRRQLENDWVSLRTYRHSFGQSRYVQPPTYRRYLPEIDGARGMGRFMKRGMEMAMPMAMADSPVMERGRAANAAPKLMMGKPTGAILGDFADDATDDGGNAEPPGSDVDLSDVSPRRNLNETAFFFPELRADENGVVSMQFTMPEALTRWRLLGFAHTRQLAGGLVEDSAVTSKDLMVQPNPPRTLREGDEIELTVKVSNQSPTVQTGVVALELSSARTGESVDDLVGNETPRQSFEIPAGQSKSFSWRVQIPDGLGFLTYKAVGSTGRLSDGEEGYLPVLSRRILVHESLALPIRGNESKTFTLEKLASLPADSIDHQSLRIQMTSNPAWYAVMSLPYLMQFPHECSEQTFNRFYANSLAQHIATSDPKIERVFENWRNQPLQAGRETLASPLLQNKDLQSIALTETPWVIEAKSQSEARRNVGILFDLNRTRSESENLQTRLAELQFDDGSWPWFPGGRSNSFVTLYLATGFGRLRHLGVEFDMSSAIKSLAHLDDWMKRNYDEIKSKDRTNPHLSSTTALYLYGRSFFVEDQPIADSHREAFEYWISQASKHWLSLGSRISQGHVAISLHRLGQQEAANQIVRSLRERAVNDDKGMHWNDGFPTWWWYHAPIESQAMMIEVFDEVAADRQAVERCKEWLLRQKETNDWETTKATADAVYALILRGVDLLADNTLVEVKVGGTKVEPQDVETGTGFYQQHFSPEQITPEMGKIDVTKTTSGIAWGGVHWKYFQRLEDITPHDGTPLEIEKQLFVVRSVNGRDVLEVIEDGLASGEPLDVGDEIVSRLIVRSSQDMEFIHLKDSRGSGTEPTNVLSGYRWQDAIGYYQSTKDAAEHFFMDYLPKGTYVLESRSRVQLRGRYQSGLATIESMYAPAYNSHSESHLMNVE